MSASAGACGSVPTPNTSKCRYLSWDDYFIALAFLSAQRSKDPNKQVRARLCGPNVPVVTTPLRPPFLLLVE